MTFSKILILYGSETGTAQGIAESIWRDAKRLKFSGNVMPMDEYNISDLIFEPLIFFITSTTGQGDPPENMKKFWKFLLRKNLPSNSLKKCWVAVLGLGDSSYSKFNFAAKKLARRLSALGAQFLIDTGLCDDQHELGIDAVAGPWITKLWMILRSFSPEVDLTILGKRSLISRWCIEELEDEPDALDFPPGKPDERVWVTVSENIRTTPCSHFQEVRLISLEPDFPVNYNPGTTAVLRPCSTPSSVSLLLSLLGERANVSFRLLPNHLPLPSVLQQKVLSVPELASTYWDLNCTISGHLISGPEEEAISFESCYLRFEENLPWNEKIKWLN